MQIMTLASIENMSHGHTSEEEDLEGSETSVAQIQVNYQTKKLHRVTLVLTYRKSFLIILLLCILWVVGHCGGCCLELHGIDEEWKGFGPWVDWDGA